MVDPLGDPFLDISAVGIDGLDRPFQGLQRLNCRHQFHPVVSGLRFALQFSLSAVPPQDRPPAARTRITAAGTVSKDFNPVFSFARTVNLPRRQWSRIQPGGNRSGDKFQRIRMHPRVFRQVKPVVQPRQLSARRAARKDGKSRFLCRLQRPDGFVPAGQRFGTIRIKRAVIETPGVQADRNVECQRIVTGKIKIDTPTISRRPRECIVGKQVSMNNAGPAGQPSSSAAISAEIQSAKPGRNSSASAAAFASTDRHALNA